MEEGQGETGEVVATGGGLVGGRLVQRMVSVGEALKGSTPSCSGAERSLAAWDGDTEDKSRTGLLPGQVHNLINPFPFVFFNKKKKK